MNLDLYRPANQKKNLPVLIYIHGGNNQLGASDEIDGTTFVQTHDWIYVNILNTF